MRRFHAECGPVSASRRAVSKRRGVRTGSGRDRMRCSRCCHACGFRSGLDGRTGACRRFAEPTPACRGADDSTGRRASAWWYRRSCRIAAHDGRTGRRWRHRRLVAGEHEPGGYDCGCRSCFHFAAGCRDSARAGATWRCSHPRRALVGHFRGAAAVPSRTGGAAARQPRERSGLFTRCSWSRRCLAPRLRGTAGRSRGFRALGGWFADRVAAGGRPRALGAPAEQGLLAPGGLSFEGRIDERDQVSRLVESSCGSRDLSSLSTLKGVTLSSELRIGPPSSL